MSKTIGICNYQLSQYHAGQMVTPTAKIWCDGESWYSLVSWHDASDGSVVKNTARHKSQAKAEAAVNSEVIVSSESWSRADSRKLAALKKISGRYGFEIPLAVTTAGECKLDGKTIDPYCICDAIEEKLRAKTIEKYNDRLERWEVNVVRTGAMHAAIAKAMK